MVIYAVFISGGMASFLLRHAGQKSQINLRLSNNRLRDIKDWVKLCYVVSPTCDKKIEQ